MFVYLVEEDFGDGMDSIATVTTFAKALELLKLKNGIITKIEVGKVYAQGIGECDHWHIQLGIPDNSDYNDSEPEENTNALQLREVICLRKLPYKRWFEVRVYALF